MLRGTPAGLEFVFAGRPFEEAWADMSARLAERPGFYRGSVATAVFGDAAPDDADVGAFLAGIAEYGISLRGIYGADAVVATADRFALSYLGAPSRSTIAQLGRKRASRATTTVPERVRSLDADFAGARADIANRRKRGESSVPRPNFAAVPAQAPAGAAVAAASVAPEPTVLYHRGTLRGGRSLQHLGTIVVVGDVNPGAELVATGDVLIFGALRGTAHAGAQGDASARVVALDLSPTQLRIATFIAAETAVAAKRAARGPSVALVEGGRIVVAALSEVS